MNLDLESEPLEVGFGQPSLSQSWACGPVGLVTGTKLAPGLAGEAEAEGLRSRVGLVCVGCQRGLSLGPGQQQGVESGRSGRRHTGKSPVQGRCFIAGVGFSASSRAGQTPCAQGPPALSLSPSRG